MRLSKLVSLFGIALVAAACGKDDVTNPPLPALAQVRFVNGVNDTGAVDIRPQTQVDLVAFANNLNFRAGTIYIPTEAKEHRFRVFLTSTDAAVTSKVMLEATVTFTADTRVTLLLTGSARAGTLRFVTITDDVSAPPAGQVGVRLVNASTGAVDGYFTNTTTDPLTPPPSVANVATLTASAYVNRAGASTNTTAARTTAPSSTTALASAAGPTTTAPAPGVLPAAGVNSPGTRLSAYYFAAGVAGSAQASRTTPAIVWFVDRNPAD